MADAVRVLYDESAVAAHERPGTPFGFADVLKIAHARPEAGAQSELFRHILASRGGPAHGSPVSLPRLHARAALYRLSRDERRDVMRRTDAADLLAQAAMTADMIPGWLGEPLDAPAWAAILPLMSYRDLLRALPDLEEAGVDDRTAEQIAATLADGERVARAGVRPLEILAADRTAPSRRWSRALERAIDAAGEAVPGPPGRTLVLVDRSASMFAPVNDDAAITAADQAAVFGAALALRARHADLVQFGAAHARVPFEPGDGLTVVTGRFREMGDGDAATAIRSCFDRHDRIVIVTSGSPGPVWDQEGPAGRVPSYLWNVAGRGRPAEQVGRHVFRGLTDGAFDAISFLESARDCRL
ncbi:hypothetical protein OG979_00665 [Actinomadura citrea]|uniref:hypothetical protein n=1 Tax=Actinomadura citrea TaxID=46158 RepID=UPI002E2ACA8B|nr:hypothetical protein [Actinomadura citrea]